MQALKDIRNKYNNAAFLIGNGPNLNAGIMPSWKELLKDAADGEIELDLSGLTNTEVYDLVELNSKDASGVKARICNRLACQISYNLEIHKRLMDFAYQTNSPVLTTNFDNAMELSVKAKMFHIQSAGFTRFYPWTSYYGFQQLGLPTDGFGIWKIHGDIKYKDSIRLGLTDYMGSAQRARKLIHTGIGRLFNENNTEFWQGYQTWLHIWFHMPIIIFGFGCCADEIFIRWLLIERRRYLNMLKEPMNVWYISKDKPSSTVFNLLHNLGVQFKIVKDYTELYGA